MPADQPQKEPPRKNDMRPRVTLSVTKGPLAGIVYTFAERTTALIGRALDCNILLPDDDTHRTISRHHCLLDINPPRARIRDLGSMNGTYISGRIIGQRAAGATPEEGGQKRFPEYDLHDKDEIMLGGTVFKVRISAPTVCAECGTSIPENSPRPGHVERRPVPLPQMPPGRHQGQAGGIQAVPHPDMHQLRQTAVPQDLHGFPNQHVPDLPRQPRGLASRADAGRPQGRRRTGRS
jgi:pSer/pThr/pTyr-binding forkhead associated (FHA) protein